MKVSEPDNFPVLAGSGLSSDVVIRPPIARAWQWLPAIFAFALLAFQAAIPWTTHVFVTQDGPSHLYTGIVLKDLMLHRHSPYSSVYMPQPEIVPNSASAVLLAMAATVVGTAHAEQLLASFCLIVGFFAISYALAALDPQTPPWSPLTNFLLLNSFLSTGFYNFYIGMALFGLAIGFYVRHWERLTKRSALLLATGLVGLFFTHIMAAALAAMTVVVVALWMHIVGPFLSTPGRLPLRRTLTRLGMLTAALLPLLLLTIVFSTLSREGVQFRPELARSFNEFPVNLFIIGPGRSGTQELLWPAILFYMTIAAFAIRRREWSTPRAGILIAAVLTVVLYLLLPDDGFGGQEVKKRLAWAVFILGCLVACSVTRLQPVRIVVSIYVASFLAGTLVTSVRVSRAIGSAVGEYVSAMSNIPDGATFVRVYFPIPGVPVRFGFAGVPLAPLFHADAYVAASRHMIDLSDYQAASGLFPVTYVPVIDTAHRYSLWGLENSANKNRDKLRWLRATLPISIDYVVVVGDAASADGLGIDMRIDMRPMATTARDAFVRVYQRTGVR